MRHDMAWLDFNMFQSGLRRYDQDTLGLRYGEDNWKYMVADYNKTPVKPSLDGEQGEKYDYLAATN
jgi:hypothetical protein